MRRQHSASNSLCGLQARTKPQRNHHDYNDDDGGSAYFYYHQGAYTHEEQDVAGAAVETIPQILHGQQNEERLQIADGGCKHPMSD